MTAETARKWPPSTFHRLGYHVFEISQPPIRRPQIARETILCALIVLPALVALIVSWWRFLV